MFKNKHEDYIPTFLNVSKFPECPSFTWYNAADDFSYHFICLYKILCNMIMILSTYRCLNFALDG